MTQDNNSPIRLVQIEPIRRSDSSSSESEVELDLPALSESEIYRRKAYIGFRKIIGFFYTRHSYGATRRWVLSKILPDRILYRWKPYQRGGCNRCGACCKIVFRCPFYYEDQNTTACLIYTSPKHAPPPCVVYPIDPIDLAEVQREVAPEPCPFYFEGQPEHPTTWGAVKAEIRAEFGKRVDKLKEAFDF
jgi:hypothetical protein